MYVGKLASCWLAGGYIGCVINQPACRPRMWDARHSARHRPLSSAAPARVERKKHQKAKSPPPPPPGRLAHSRSTKVAHTAGTARHELTIESFAVAVVATAADRILITYQNRAANYFQRVGKKEGGSRALSRIRVCARWLTTDTTLGKWIKIETLKHRRERKNIRKRREERKEAEQADS